MGIPTFLGVERQVEEMPDQRLRKRPLLYTRAEVAANIVVLVQEAVEMNKSPVQNSIHCIFLNKLPGARTYLRV